MKLCQRIDVRQLAIQSGVVQSVADHESVRDDEPGEVDLDLDLAGDEVRFPATPQRPAFEAARAAGLHLTCHAGEAGDPSHVEEALDLGAERIAHGVIGAGDARVAARLQNEGIVLDMCPTANWKTKAVPTLADHPLPRLVRAGVRCTISTDSRTVANTTLTHEFELMAAIGMTDEELQLCNRTAYAAKFG